MQQIFSSRKKFFVWIFVGILSLSSAAPAFADVGLGVRVDPTGTQNFYYGKANSAMPANTSFLLMEQPAGTAKFRVDGSGKVYSANSYCDISGNNCISPSGSNYWGAGVPANSIYNTNTGFVGIGTNNPGYKLDVNGDLNVPLNNALRFNGGWGVGSDATQISIGSQAAAKAVGIYPQGNSTPAFYANTSGNVGIGTNNPVTKLDVNGAINSNSIIYGLNGFNSGVTTGVGGSPGTWAPIAKISITSQYGFGSADILLSIDGASGGSNDYGKATLYLRAKQQAGMASPLDYVQLVATNLSGNLSNTDIVFVKTTDNGSLKEGTLYVRNNVSYTEILYTVFNNSGGGGGLSVYPSGSGTGSLPAGTQYALSYSSYDNGSSVGIGTTGPGAKLEVAGSGAAAEVRINSNYIHDNEPRLTFYSADTDNAAERNWGIVTSNYQWGDLAIKQSSSRGGDPIAGTARLYLDPSGNVGIGTTAPAAPLHISSSNTWTSNGWTRNMVLGTTEAASIQLGYGGGTRWGIGNSTNLYIWSAGVDNTSGAAAYRGMFDTSGNVWLGGSSANSSPTMYIGANGNVGIGTTGPNGNLTIYKDQVVSATTGNLLLEHPSSGGASSIVFSSRANNGSDYGFITYYDDNNNYNYWGDSNENSALVVGTQNDGLSSVSDVVVLKPSAATIVDSNLIANGTVGIGTASPQNTLHLYGSSPWIRLQKSGALNATEAGIYFTNSDASAGLYLWSDNSDNGALKIESQALAGESDATPRASFPPDNKNIYLAQSGGTVGIGTNNPAQGKLWVQDGDIWVTGNNRLAFSSDESTDNTPNVAIKASGNDTYFSNWSGTQYLDRMVIQGSNGRVGIGTTAPNYKLEVIGSSAESGIHGDGGIYGVYGTGYSIGVYGVNNVQLGSGVYGTSNTGGTGVTGRSSTGEGVYGWSDKGWAVYSDGFLGFGVQVVDGGQGSATPNKSVIDVTSCTSCGYGTTLTLNNGLAFPGQMLYVINDTNTTTTFSVQGSAPSSPSVALYGYKGATFVMTHNGWEPMDQ